MLLQLLLLCSLPVQAKLPIMKNRLAALPTRLLHAPLLKLLLLTLLLLTLPLLTRLLPTL